MRYMRVCQHKPARGPTVEKGQWICSLLLAVYTNTPPQLIHLFAAGVIGRSLRGLDLGERPFSEGH